MGLSTVLEFLGIGLDTEKNDYFLTRQKEAGPDRTYSRNKKKRKSASKEELQSLAGKLQHASKVIIPGRCLIRSVYELTSLRQKTHNRICLTRDFKSDLSWWYTFVEQWNGTSLHQYPEVTVIRDAAGSWECGALSLFKHKWLLGTTGMSIKSLSQ